MKISRIILGSVGLIVCFSISVAGLVYSPPYQHIIGDRIDAAMPVPFDFSTSTKMIIIEENFDNNTYSSPLVGAGTLPDGCSFANGMIKMEKNTSAAKAVTFTYSFGFNAGDYYAFSCKIKTESLTGGVPRNILAAYKNNNVWLDETHGYDGYKDIAGDHDWYEMRQVFRIPEGTTHLRLSAYMGEGVTGTVYYDEFKLYKIALNPLETVLCSPSYKGLIYGNGGEGDIDLDIRVYDYGGFYKLEDLTLSVKLLNPSNEVISSAYKDKVSPSMNVVFSSKNLGFGDYYLQTLLTDKKTGTVLSKQEHTIRKRQAEYRPSVYLDVNHHIVKNGQKSFLTRLYNYNGNYSEVATAVSDTAIKTISNYGMWWAANTNEKPIEALQFMRNNGITSHICLSSYWFSDRSGNMGTSLIAEQRDIRSLFTLIANDYKNDPVLEGYYVFDEPDPAIVGDEIRWNNEILADADIKHPTFGVADTMLTTYGIYTKMADILGVDPYPVTGSGTDDIAKVGRDIQQIKQNFPNRPVYIVLQGFNKKLTGQTRSPSYKELRNMAYQAVCEGAEGVDCYAYPDMKNDPSKDFATWWQEITTLYGELKSYESILLSDNPGPALSLSNDGEWLNIMTRRYNGKTYLFSVNNTGLAKSTDITLKNIETARNLDTDEIIPSTNGIFTLSYTPYEVKVLEIIQADYLSPKAEISSMGFFNCQSSYLVAEGASNTLYVPRGTCVINYNSRISDNAKLYINGTEKPMKGKIKVSPQSLFTVTVIAEDGVQKSEKKYYVVAE